VLKGDVNVPTIIHQKFSFGKGERRKSGWQLAKTVPLGCCARYMPEITAR